MTEITGGMNAAKKAAQAAQAAQVAQTISNWDRGLEEIISRQIDRIKDRPSPDERLPWNQHDSDIQTVVNEYNAYLGSTSGYQSLDWHLIKAILFVETGPGKQEWAQEPMQSDNAGDVGLKYMNSQSLRENLIVPPSLRGAVTAANTSAYNNIAAGVGYLLFRAAHFKRVTASTDHKYGPNNGWVIVGWDLIDPESVAQTYNANGRGTYAAELTFAYDLIRRERYLR